MSQSIKAEPGNNPKIGPVATDLLFENEQVKVWQMNRGPKETFWHHYHNYDYVLFPITDLLGANDGEEEHQRVWDSRTQAAAAQESERRGTLFPAHAVHYIPGTGWLSPGFINLGENRWLAALVEIKRPRTQSQEHVGYARSDALVGMEPRPGSVHILENDRVRVYETALEPGQGDQPREQLESGVYVIDGGRIRIIEEDEKGNRRSVEQEYPSVSGYFAPGGVRRQIINIGPTRYRQLSVEVK
ncbi:MAG TPA: hypothetical protein VGY99_04740 [Candidatus Binataceae bacterium]|jgi:hypothetical protein|nr:hypothetical protein [Candidatus Binataceae bacterium]